MKGIILAGGSGTRLYPLTIAVSKQLLPVYDKPMVYYPITTLKLAGVTEILVITTPKDAPLFEKLLGDGWQWGLSIQYAVQDQPKGIADALLIGERFIGQENVMLMLGDNIIFGDGLGRSLQRLNNPTGATIFAYRVANPSDYGVVSIDQSGMAVSIEEKPAKPTSKYAIPGLYFYDNKAIQFAKELTPSGRGELEITDLNKRYLELGELAVEVLSQGTVWMDMGSIDGLTEASEFVRVVQSRQGIKIGDPGLVSNPELP